MRTSHSNWVVSAHHSCSALQLNHPPLRVLSSDSDTSFDRSAGSVRGVNSLKVSEVRFVGDDELLDLAMRIVGSLDVVWLFREFCHQVR